MNLRDELDIRDRLVFACDYDDIAPAMEMLRHLRGKISTIKIGMEMFTKFGPHLISAMKSKEFKIWLDMKFMDIPNTVKGAVKSAQSMGVDMLTIHLLGGRNMIKEALKVSTIINPSRPWILGVSILTSLDNDDMAAMNFGGDTEHQVRCLVSIGNRCGIHGIVCSAQEVEKLRSIHPDLMIVTPGIRLDDGNMDDQKRVGTPKVAIQNGSDILVVGRALKNAVNKAETIDLIINEIREGLSARSGSN